LSDLAIVEDENTAEELPVSLGGVQKPGTTYCRVCAYEMPAAAKKCTKCDSWTKRRWLGMTETTLSLLIALFSVLGTLAPQITKLVFRSSDTRVSVVSCNAQDLTVAVSNSGSRTSAVRDGYVDFLDMPIKSIPRMALRRVTRKECDGSPAVMPGKESQICLRADTFPLTALQELSLDNWIANGTVEVTVNVQESSDDIHHTTERKDVIAAKYVEEWIKGRVSVKKEQP